MVLTKLKWLHQKNSQDMVEGDMKRTMALVPDNHPVSFAHKELLGCNAGETLIVDVFNGRGPEGFAYLECPSTVMHFNFSGKTGVHYFETIYLGVAGIKAL